MRSGRFERLSTATSGDCSTLIAVVEPLRRRMTALGRLKTVAGGSAKLTSGFENEGHGPARSQS